MQRVKNQIQGRVKFHAQGFGLLLRSQNTPPFVIAKNNLWGLMEGDVVLAKVRKKRYRHFDSQVEILQVLNRKHSHIIGIYQKKNEKSGWIQNNRFLWKGELLVKQSSSSLENQWVLVRITHYPKPSKKTFEGSIEHIFGRNLEAKEDLLRTHIEYQLPKSFPKEVEEESKTPRFFQINEAKKSAQRKNLQHLPFCTVDGETAKDFDDAIYVEQKKKGFIAFVAIADVSAYVDKDSLMDQEAFKRGTSIYFTNTSIPMLPPILSENLCSLMPQQIRFVLVAEMDFQSSGQLSQCQFYPASIQSHARLTYTQAQDFLDKKNPIPNNLSKVFTSIKAASHLTKLLLQKKEERGAMHFRKQGMRVIISKSNALVLNAKGTPIGFTENPVLFSHKIIEELMIVANIQSALYLLKNQKPLILRVHEKPDNGSLDLLYNQFLQLGWYSPILESISHAKKTNLSRELQKLLSSVCRGQENEILAHILVLRCMQKAIYSTDESMGHFGLALDTYTHFTSPIRRYTDLTVHRMLKSTLENKKDPYTKKELKQIAKHLSECELKAVQAERFFDNLKKARWAQNHIGKQFQTFINSITPLGIFTFIPEYDLHGLIQREDLEEMGFYFDRRNRLFVQNRGSSSYKLGDKVDIKIKNVRIETGKINFALINAKKPQNSLQNKDKEKEKEKNLKKTKDSHELNPYRKKHFSHF